MQKLSAFFIGLLFGLGLLLSGMTDPGKVQGFLDLAGAWDPSLAFVMGGAVVVAFLGYRLAWHHGRTLTGTGFDLPKRNDLEARLLAGAALFGLGWGLSGFCPGPAIVAVPLAAQGTLAFVPAMLIGMWAARQLTEWRGTVGAA